jgi:hypothetical protein
MDRRGSLCELLVSAFVRAGWTAFPALTDCPRGVVFVVCSSNSCVYTHLIGSRFWFSLELVYGQSMWVGQTVRVGEVEVLGSGGFFRWSKLECRTVCDPDGQLVSPVQVVRDTPILTLRGLSLVVLFANLDDMWCSLLTAINTTFTPPTPA